MKPTPPAPGSDPLDAEHPPADAEASSRSDHAGPDRPGTISGKIIIAVTASLLVIVPVIVFIINDIVAADLDHPPEPLQWDQHRDWDFLPITGASMRRGMMSSARTGKQFFDFKFNVSPDQEQTIHEVADLAALPRDRFTQPATRDKLRELTDQEPDLFYPAYVLGIWHRLAGDRDAADRWLSKAFSLAPAVLRQPVVDRDAHRLTDHPVPAQALALDRVQDDKLNPSLVLVYPPNVSDDRGEVYLPVYKMIYRQVPPGETATLLPRNPDTQWFTFPGRFGELDARTLSTSP